jgi:hypothetical protein
LPTDAQKTACKEKICASQIGQLLNNGLSPLGAFTGGLLGPCCPLYKQSDLLKPSDSAEGAAAKIKADAAGAKARIAAVKYLARVDCSIWPEAADALVNALRADKVECVRYAAAEALGTGCCCGKKTIVALSIAAAGSDRDGNPPEKSDRVRSAAQSALENCLARCGCAIPVPTAPTREGPIEGPAPIKQVGATEAPATKPVEPAVFYKRAGSMSSAELTETLRQCVMEWKQPPGETPAGGDVNLVMATGTSHAADHSLMGVVASAMGPAKNLFAPPGRQTIPPPRAEVAKVTETAAETPYQAKPVQTVAYQEQVTRSWQPDAETKPATPAYQVPVTRAWQPDAESKPATPTHQVPVTRAWQPDAGTKPATQAYQAPATPDWKTDVQTKPVTPAWKLPAPKPVQAAAAKNSPAQSQFPPATGMDVGHMLKLLRDGTHPEQRVWAASELASVDGRGNPDVVDALVATAQIDASASVRLQCVKTLVKMNVGGTAVHELLETLQSDVDANVQMEARRALGQSKN